MTPSSVTPYSMASVSERLWTDLPFIYALDASAQNVNSLQGIQILTDRDGSDFYLRRIVNMRAFAQSTNARFRYVLPYSGAWASNSPIHVQQEWVVAPEVKFIGGDSIQFDILNGTVPAVTEPLTVVGFQGVRRYPTRVNMRPTVPGNWRELPQQYAVNVSLGAQILPPTAAFAVTATFQQEVFNYDFVLRRILIVNSAGAEVGGSNIEGTPASGQAYYQLWDAAGRGLSNIPVPDVFLSWNSASGSEGFVSLFPVPELIYPNGSNIRFQVWNDDVTGELGSATIRQQVIFDGVYRIPCA
jgi:hypothetical protein